MKQILFLIILALIGLSCYAQRGYVEDAMYEKYGREHAAKGEDWMKNMMSGKVEPEYLFPIMMKMHMTSYRNGSKKDESDLTYYFNTTANRFAMRAVEERKKKKEPEQMLMIYDYKANSLVMLNETDKTGMAMNLNAFMSGDAIKRRNEGKGGPAGNADANCKKTGKTKTIQGYKCEEWICVDLENDSRSELWISNRMPFDISQSGGRGPMAGYFSKAGGLGGMMMEGVFYKGGELEMKMEVVAVNPEENLTVKTASYKFAMR